MPEWPRTKSIVMAADDAAILKTFAAAARQRGLVTGLPAPAVCFALVRDMPYRRPSRPDLPTMVAEWCGTCSSKHRLLQALLAAHGLSSRLMVATYHYRWTLNVPAPPPIAAILQTGPVPDVHNFLEVASTTGWQTLDATWPRAGAKLGFPVNERWMRGTPQHVACLPPFTAWPVPPDVDVAAYKNGVVDQWCGVDRPRRERLILALSAFISDAGLSP